MTLPGQRQSFINGNTVDTDVLIIGSGLAGLLAALRLGESGASVVLATKGGLEDSNSSFAQGGVAAVTGANPFDAPEAHLDDTIRAGAGLTDENAARDIIIGGASLIAEFDRLGVEFDRSPAGGHDLALEGGHKQARVLHRKDSTGRSITTALAARVREASAAAAADFRILENSYALDLIVEAGVCRGAKFLTTTGETFVRARHTVLATGGLGQVFERTTNPLVATGDGIALAYRAGAELADMEFVQFHPTALRLDGAPAFLITEAARGAGAALLDHKGRRFAFRFHQDGELATRDIVARAIHSVMMEYDQPNVFLDLRPIGKDAIAERFPGVLSTCAQYGVDVLSQPIPVAPAAHYMMGGIRATVSGVTSLRGLYAIGECACTGLHGANRLASNSLLEAGVMAIKLSESINAQSSPLPLRGAAASVTAAVKLPADLTQFRSLMYRHAGLVRSASGLSVLLSSPSLELTGPPTPDQASARNIYQVGQLIARAALMRKESRGAHLRSDFAEMDDERFSGHIWLSRDGYGWQESKADALSLSPVGA